MPMRRKHAIYWAATAAVAGEMLGGGATDLARGRAMVVVGEPVADVVRRLGYPSYVLTILGLWKVAGGAVLLAPGLPRLKEWAYAGTVFAMTGAAASAIAARSWGDLPVPTAFAALALASWALRPEGRTLGNPARPALPAPASSAATSRGT